MGVYVVKATKRNTMDRTPYTVICYDNIPSIMNPTKALEQLRELRSVTLGNSESSFCHTHINTRRPNLWYKIV